MYKIGFNYAIRNIKRTPLRSFFTIFSVSMIISMYTLLTSISNSFLGEFKKLMNQEDIDIIVQSKFAATPLASSISSKDFIAITSDNSILESIPLVLGKKRLNKGEIVYLLGIKNFEQVSNKLGISIQKGGLFKPRSNEILIASRLLLAKKLKINENIKLSEEKEFKIVGSFYSWISFFNSAVIADLYKTRELLNKKDKTSMLFLILKKSHKVDEMIKKINKNYSSLQAIKSSDFSKTLGAIKNIFYLSDIIAIIAIVIASAILINTFIIAVYERTKEIGILRTVGWTKRMIVSIFMTESIIFAIIGGIFGFIISVFMLYYLKTNYANIDIYLPSSLNLKDFFYTFLMALFIGGLSAILPALYASKISIAKAIRNE